MPKISLSRRAKSIAFGLAGIVPMDFLCMHTPVHAIGLRPASSLLGEPEKQPWQKSKLHKPRYGRLPLVLTQERRKGAETWMRYSTSIDHPPINIWGPGALGRPHAHKKLPFRVARAKRGGTTHFSLSRKGG